MAYSQATLINEIRHLLGAVNDERDSFTGNITATAETIPVADGTDYSVGDVIEFQDDGEACLVRSIAGNNLTCTRNYLLSVTSTEGTGTAHNGSVTAIGLIKNPTYLHSSVRVAISAALRALWPHVYKKVTSTITPVSGTYWYKVDDEMYELSSAVQKKTDNVRLQFYGGRRNTYRISIARDLPSGFPEAATVAAVNIPRFNNTTNTILVVGIAPLNDDVTGGNYDDLSEGIQAETVKYLASAELVGAKDIQRSTESDVRQGDATVSPGQRTALALYWYRRGLASRDAWKRELESTLPRMREF